LPRFKLLFVDIRQQVVPTEGEEESLEKEFKGIRRWRL
jgi:hypothetical protein